MKISINQFKLFCETFGNPSDTALVFLHGFPLNHEMWMPQLEVLAKNYFCVAYDLRGHGLSDVGDGQYTLEGHVDDLFSLLDQLNIKKSVVIGLSMGGYIALRALERDPKRFKALVLCDTRSSADNNEGKIKRALGIKDVKKNGSEIYAKTAVQSLLSKTTKKTNPQLVDYVIRMMQMVPPLGIAGTLLALAGRTDSTDFLSKIMVPTLILVGSEDILTPPEISKVMHEKIPMSELKVISHAGHLSNLENPDEFNRYLCDFLIRNKL